MVGVRRAPKGSGEIACRIKCQLHGLSRFWRTPRRRPGQDLHRTPALQRYRSRRQRLAEHSSRFAMLLVRELVCHPGPSAANSGPSSRACPFSADIPCSDGSCPRLHQCFTQRQRHPHQGRHVPRYEFISWCCVRHSTCHLPIEVRGRYKVRETLPRRKEGPGATLIHDFVQSRQVAAVAPVPGHGPSLSRSGVSGRWCNYIPHSISSWCGGR
jgi:hypothetical protein